MNNKEQEEFDEFFDIVGTEKEKKEPDPILVPLIRQFNPKKLTELMVSVQPMSSSIRRQPKRRK